MTIYIYIHTHTPLNSYVMLGLGQKLLCHGIHGPVDRSSSTFMCLYTLHAHSYSVGHMPIVYQKPVAALLAVIMPQVVQ